MIGIGVILDKAFELDLSTLSKINFYVFVPALLFIKIISTNISLNEMVSVVIFSVIHFALLLFISILLFSLIFFRENRNTLILGTILTNVGNYGIPLVLFAFGESYLDILAVLIMIQNILTFTLGPYLLKKEGRNIKELLKEFLKIPSLYAIIIALFFNAYDIKLIPLIENPLTIIADGLISMALITLGIQLSRIKMKKNLREISSVVILRLVISPLLALAVALLLGLSELLSVVLIIASGFPSAVNSYILALEYDNNFELASQLIFWSTILSAISIPILILVLN